MHYDRRQHISARRRKLSATTEYLMLLLLFVVLKFHISLRRFGSYSLSRKKKNDTTHQGKTRDESVLDYTMVDVDHRFDHDKRIIPSESLRIWALCANNARYQMSSWMMHEIVRLSGTHTHFRSTRYSILSLQSRIFVPTFRYVNGKQ